jgi:hypothetical protein
MPLKRMDGWNSETVYRCLMQLPLFKNDPKARSEFLATTLDSRLSVVISETVDYRALLDRVQLELYRPRRKPDGLDSANKWDAAGASRKPVKLNRNVRRRMNRKAGDLAATQSSQSGGRRAKQRVLGSSDVKMPARKPEDVLHPCPYCKGLPMAQRCIRNIYVTPQKWRHLVGGALTCASRRNRLRPKPPVSSCQYTKWVHIS